MLLALILTGLITPEEAFEGFASPAVVTVWAIFIVSGGLFYTGVANLLGSRLLKLAGTSQKRLVGLLMAAVGLMSGVMNNVGATAVLMPAVVSMSRKARINASRLLMPLAYGSLLGGMMTLIGTPPNILVSGALTQAGYGPFSLLDFAPVGLTALLVGTVYMVFVGYRLLPDHTPAERLAPAAGAEEELVDLYQLGERLFRARVPVGSPLIGKTLAESGLRQDFELSIIGLQRRGSNADMHQTMTWRFDGGTSSLWRAWWTTWHGPKIAHLLEVQPEVGVHDRDLQSEAVGMAEALLSPRSRLVGKTLDDLRFREHFGLSVIAILRDGRPRRTGLALMPLRFGDTLLVQGSRQNIVILQRDPDFVVLGDAEPEPTVRVKKGAAGGGAPVGDAGAGGGRVAAHRRGSAAGRRSDGRLPAA